MPAITHRFPSSARTLAAGLALAATAVAAAAGEGAILGRVFDPGRGDYVEHARVTLSPGDRESFSDFSGTFRFDRVPAGEAIVTVFFTGSSQHSVRVMVPAGGEQRLDVRLDDRERPVPMSRFVVAGSRELEGASVAIQTQRVARNMIGVVAADQFGTVVDSTPGEVLKFLPGVALDYSAGEPRNVSLGGVPANYVPITIGGFELASAASNGTSRVTHLDQFSINSLSRIEVHHSPTPESPGGALAGLVNMVPRSAFERARPHYAASTFLMMKDSARDFHKTPGPLGRPTRKVTPGLSLSAVVPVNERFGFTLSGNFTDQYSLEDVATSTWRGVGADTNGSTLPDTTPDRPYLSEFSLRDSTRDNRLYSAGLTVDAKLTPQSVLSLALHYTYLGVVNNNRTLAFVIDAVAPGAWGPTFTRGLPGRGEVRVQGSQRDWLATTASPTLTWRHIGPQWKLEAGAGYSRASLHVRGIDKGWFVNSLARRSGVTVSFADIFYLRPNTITVTDAAGAPVNTYDLSGYSLVSANDEPRDSLDLKRRIHATAARPITLAGRLLELKAGLDLRHAERDLGGHARPFTFTGPPGTATQVLDESFSQRTGAFGFPRIQWLSNEAYYALYRAHPEQFTIDEVAHYRSRVSTSRRAEELVSAAFLRADTAFLARRLQLTGGLRAEQTNVAAEGALTDPERNFARQPDGTLAPIVPSTDALRYAQQTFIARGQRTRREYLRLFPSLNASFALRENLVARAAYYRSIGRPDFSQYAGGLTLPDPSSGPGPANPIRVNNAGIKPWRADTVKLRLEHYFRGIGQLSVAAFQRDFVNFFGSTTQPATPQFLALHDLDPAVYGSHEVVTQRNLADTVRMTGVELDYRQALSFLPAWAGHVQVFASGHSQRATGAPAGNFAGFLPRSASWGVSVARPLQRMYLNWNYRAAQRRNAVSPGRSIGPGTFNWGAKRLYLDLHLEQQLRRGIAFFANFRNVGNATEDFKIHGPATPGYARFRQRTDYAASWTFGVKGEY